MELKEYIKKMVAAKASDLFITVGRPICMKVNYHIVNLTAENLTPEQTKSFTFNLMSETQRSEFLAKKEFNFAIEEPKLGRFRANAFVQRSYYGLVLRRIETDIPTLAELNIHSNLAKLAMLKRGLILIVGATGSGKSSTLAAMINHRNQHTTGHIISIEDPIEFLHEHKSCIITQREVEVDTDSFANALKNTLRQAPDVILLGEIRTEETMNYAISFAETGHLCLSTLHANNANQALDRIINFFPATRHAQIWADLSLNLRAIIGQQLIPTTDGKNLMPAMEVLVNTPAVADNIKKGEVHLLKDFMEKGSEQGMQTFDQSLFALYKDGHISYEDALRNADSENELRLMIKLDKGADPNSKDIFGLQER